MTMLKKNLCLILCAVLLQSMCLLVLATGEDTPQEETAETPVITVLYITSPDSFLRFAQNCLLDSYSRDLRVELLADIDLTGVPFSGVPIFCGSFYGNNHTISGLSITAEGSALGLFRYLTADALVADLTVEGDVLPQGSQNSIGGLVGENQGRLENCHFRGSISGSDKVGGIAGVNGVTGILENCHFSGSINGDHFVGGIVGENMGVVRRCSNSAPVNTTPQQNNVELSDITLENLTGSESAGTVTDVGGIAGTSGGVIRSCENNAQVGYRQMGYNIGGIAGSQMGYVVNCANHAPVYGRKEVGGIVGQAEPVTSIVYTEDTLQQLEQQLDAMGAAASRASANAQGSAAAVTGQIAALQDNAQTAMDAVDVLLGSGIPDADSLTAAQNALNSSFSGMQGNIQSISSTVQTAAATLSSDMQALMGQISAMGATLKAAPENLGGTVTDISDLDTAADTAAKIASCKNYGAVLADLNAGGIVGSMAPENDLDPEEDVEVTGNSSLNFDSELRVVVLACENSGSVTAGKQNCGGIAGTMALGLVKNSLNTGSLTSPNADYVGGVAGRSIGYIRKSHANCLVSGSTYVGGIAGDGTTVSDCYSMVHLSAVERVGAILGFADSRENITGNYYMTLETDPGAIDGISYDGCAQGLGKDSFLRLGNLPAVFRRITVTFVFADGTEEKVNLAPGQALQKSDIPALPMQAGCTAAWEGLDDLDIRFDTVFHAVYTPYSTVLASADTTGDSKPLVLAEGSFLPGEQVQLLDAPRAPDVPFARQVVFRTGIHMPESIVPVTLRCLLPEGAVDATAMVQTADGVWQSVASRTDGSYLVFEAPQETTALVLVASVPFPWMWIILAGAALACAAIAIPVIRKYKKR